MKYCIQYKKDFKYITDIDELTINFRRQDKTLIDFLLLFKDKRINIFIEDEEDFIESRSIQLFDAIVTEHPEVNFAFKLRNYKSGRVRDLVNILNDRPIKHKYFFKTFVNDWDTLLGYIELKPSDIYIVESLGFEIVAVANLLHSKGIRVRTFPNVAQSSWKETPALMKFFIRPEDINLYETYVDTMEFFGRDNRIETYYKIYAIDKKWTGKLNEVIIDFNDDKIDNQFILPIFAKRRLECGKACLKGRSCKICNAMIELSAVLEKNGLIVRKFKAINE